MIRYIDIDGKPKPADFSIVVVARVAKACGTDVTGLVEIVQGLGDECAFLEFAAKVGAEALTAGAKREGTADRYSEFDLHDIFTADITVSSTLVTMLVETLTEKPVFQEPTEASATPKKRKRGDE